MLRRTFTKLSLLACVGTLALTGCGGSGGNENAGGSTENVDIAENTGDAFTKNKDQILRFSAIPDHNNSELKEKFDRVAAHLSAELGITVEYVPSESYSLSVDAFEQGTIQLAWFGGLTGVQARERVAGSTAIVQGIEDPQYYSFFIAHKDAGIPAWNEEDGQPFPEAMAGKTFTFGSPSSTSGRLMPEHFIRENTRQAPADYFEGETGFSGSHDNTVAAVNAGSFQVGAVNYKTYLSMRDNGDADNTVIIWKTPYYADYNMTVRGDLDETYGDGSIARLQEVLVAIDDPALLDAFSRAELIPATNEEFQKIADVARALDFIE